MDRYLETLMHFENFGPKIILRHHLSSYSYIIHYIWSVLKDYFRYDRLAQSLIATHTQTYKPFFCRYQLNKLFLNCF